MHAKTDSDVTTTTNVTMSSAPHHRPAYYVQSPSPDSSPDRTNYHSHSQTNSWEGAMHHSREPSRFSTVAPRSVAHRKVDSSTGSDDRFVDIDVQGERTWKQPYNGVRTVEEEETLLPELMEDEEERKGLSRRWYVLGFVVVFVVLFTTFSLILWGASHNQRPVVTMKSITFLRFDVQAGTDATEVPTDLGTLNSTVKLEYRNTGSFFGVHVSATPISIYYSQIQMATGNVDYFYQSRKSHRNITVNVVGYQVPLYGAGVGLSTSPGAKPSPVNMTLSFNLRSRGNVLGKLVAPKFYNNVQCSVLLDQTKLDKVVRFNDTMCNYS